VVMDRKGYGFVTFADPKDAMTFLEVGADHQQQRTSRLFGTCAAFIRAAPLI
jgi:hypothetical protein